jgi:hypothetical protein
VNDCRQHVVALAGLGAVGFDHQIVRRVECVGHLFGTEPLGDLIAKY